MSYNIPVRRTKGSRLESKLTLVFVSVLWIDADTLKLYTKAHGAKTMNLAINLDHDEDWIMNDDEKLLVDYGIGKIELHPRSISDHCL